MPSGRSHAPRTWGTLGTTSSTRRDDRGHGHLPLTVLRIPRTVRRRGHRDLRRGVLGEGRRPRGDGLHLRRAERLDPPDGRVPYAAAKDGLFPRVFGKLGRNGTPVFGLVASSVLITGLMALNYNKNLVDHFTFVILLATLVTLVPYAFSAAADAYLMITDRSAFVSRRLVRDIVVAAVGFGYAVWTMIGSGMEIIGQGFVLWMIGVPVFVWMRWARRHEHELIEPYEHPGHRAGGPKEPVRV